MSTDFSSIKPISLLSKSRFEVYLAEETNTKAQLAMKFIPLKENRLSRSYVAEKKVASLSHPNLIKTIATVDQKETVSNTQRLIQSIIVMEYAPHGDFNDSLEIFSGLQSQRLLRTYFQQLIKGVEYLHSKGLAHLDLKLENLLLSKDFKLKIADFDQIELIKANNGINKCGTEGYRAPEAKRGCSGKVDLTKADVYSLGVILFALTFGMMPYAEDQPIRGIDLESQMQNDAQAFWKSHQSMNLIEKKKPVDPALKDLITKLTCADAEKRLSIEQIKEHSWFKGAVLKDCELKAVMAKFFAEE